MRKVVMSMVLIISVIAANAQQYSGMSGLIHLPSAEMDRVGDIRIGAHFINKKMVPDCPWLTNGVDKYNTYDFYFSVTPFWWVEVALAMVLEKGTVNGLIDNDDGFTQKDRQISVKLNPLREGKYWPAVAVGVQDAYSKGGMGGGFFSNYYIALTKNLDVKKHEFGLTLTYRKFTKVYNHRWNGVVGGITCRPSFARNWRAVVEWTGCDVNFGIDCLLWRHLLLQASLQDGKYPSAGVCYKVNLF